MEIRTESELIEMEEIEAAGRSARKKMAKRTEAQSGERKNSGSRIKIESAGIRCRISVDQKRKGIRIHNFNSISQ